MVRLDLFSNMIHRSDDPIDGRGWEASAVCPLLTLQPSQTHLRDTRVKARCWHGYKTTTMVIRRGAKNEMIGDVHKHNQAMWYLLLLPLLDMALSNGRFLLSLRLDN